MAIDEPNLLDMLRDPRISLPLYAQVVDQKTEKLVPYDPYAITKTCQSTILGYMAEPPRTEHGQTRWLCNLTGRQSGKSTTAALAMYPLAAYTAGFDAVTIADKDKRANYLHDRIHLAHEYWPEQLRSNTIPNRESRQLTFLKNTGGKMRIMSAQNVDAGIGQSVSALHASEVAFWPDAGGTFSLFFPAMVNRDNARMIVECTPAPADFDSAEWWQNTCAEARRGQSRWLYAFQPFWDGLLNVREWKKGWVPDNEELNLMNKFGEQGLTWGNLAFRRFMMDVDEKIRVNPDLFGVFYPFDDITCWQGVANGALHASVLERHKNSPHLREWHGPYMEYEAPEEDARYVIGADSAGWGVRDHASFQVLKVWRGEWTQVACYADNRCDPMQFGAALLEAGLRYNNATIVVENNGVGTGPLVTLMTANYPNIYYEEMGKPGKNASGKSTTEMLSYLAEALKDELHMRDKDTVAQLLTYRNDKLTEESATSEMLRGSTSKKRRPRHHWDKISALQMAIVGAREMSQRSKPKVEHDNVVMFDRMSYNEQQKYVATQRPAEKKSSRASKYIPVKRK